MAERKEVGSSTEKSEESLGWRTAMDRIAEAAMTSMKRGKERWKILLANKMEKANIHEACARWEYSMDVGMEDEGGKEASKAISEIRRKPKFGEPSKVLCGICHETRDRVEIYRNTSCYHLYCIKCLSAYVVHKKMYEATTTTTMICPASNCKAVLDLGPGFTLRSESSSKHQEWKDLLRGPGETSHKRGGEPSQKKFSSLQICEICCERKELGGMFRTELGCLRHRVCTDCISKYVKVKLESDVSGRIPCPGLDCRAELSPEHCKGFLPSRVVEKWEQKIIHALIPDSEKFYCPFKDCSAMLLNDNADGEMMMMRESECPHCRRLFCVRCRVPWHSGIACSEYQVLNADEKQQGDEMLKKLAHEKRWQRCPKCKFYVEKTEGCIHMTCRCKYQFCYRCGRSWSANHGICEFYG